MRSKLIIWMAVTLCLSAGVQAADESAIRDDHPERYTVQPGDTLWEISERFLTDPWLWPEIWHENPKIENPHLIYPGDVIKLTTVNGEPRLTAERGGGTVKLSPKVRSEKLDEVINTIPVSAIRPFLTGTRLISQKEFESAPYIVAGADERVISSTGDPVYVRRLPDSPAESWDVIRKEDPLVDPETGDVLGFKATKTGTVSLAEQGDPATMQVTGVKREILPGDRLIQVRDSGLQSRFTPRAPDTQIEGRIMTVDQGVSQIGQFDVIAINVGTEDGLEVGHVLGIFERGRTIKDEYGGNDEKVKLPDERAGELIIFRTFERMSFALVMESTRAITLQDVVRTP